MLLGGRAGVYVELCPGCRIDLSHLDRPEPFVPFDSDFLAKCKTVLILRY